MKVMSNKVHAILISITTILAFVFTLHPAVQPYLSKFIVLYSMGCFFGLLNYYWTRKKKISTKTNLLFVYFISITILFIVGLTDWFSSPFVYLLYVLAIMYAFIFSEVVTLFFCLTLMALFLPYAQTVPLWYSAISLISLFAVIPLTTHIQHHYLLSKQAEKKLLIIDDGKSIFKDTADEYLHNVISNISTELRQDATDIKHLASYMSTSTDAVKKINIPSKIITLSDLLLEKIEKFEEKTTGRKIMHTRG